MVMVGKRLAPLLLGIPLLAVILLGVGFFTPKQYDGEQSQVIDASPDQVWKVLSDVEHRPQYRPEIVNLQVLKVNNIGLKKWKEMTDMGAYIVFQGVEAVPNEKLVLRMEDSSFGMTGKWTYMLRPRGDHTLLTIREESKIQKLWLRTQMTFSGRGGNLKREFKLVRAALS